MSTRRQQIFSNLAAAGKKAAAVTKGAAITTGSVLAASWQDARMKDRAKFTDPTQNTTPAAKQAAAQSGPAPKDTAATGPAALTPFQKSLLILAESYKVPENDTQLMDSMKGAKVVNLPTTENPILSLGAEGTLYELTPRQIHTDADDLSPAQARRMIAFAAANPSMRKNGITIDGNEATRKLLEQLAADAGLKVLNPLVPPAPAQPAPETKAPETKTTEPAAPAPLPDHIAKVLLGGNVDETTYRAARDFVLAKDKANPNMLQVELDITRTKAKTILNALALEGVVKIDQIKTEKKESLRTIYTVAAQGTPAATTEEKPAEEKPATKPAAGPAPV